MEKAILCLALLSIDPDACSPIGQHGFIDQWDALITVANELEIVVPGERWNNHFGNELGWTLRQWKAIIDEKAPCLEGQNRIPLTEWLDEARALNVAYRDFLERIGSNDEVKYETHRIMQILGWMRVVRSGGYAASRRLALARVRDLVGEEAYYNSAWPAAVPIARFQRY